MAKRQFLESDGYPCDPTDFSDSGWYYVDAKGLHIIAKNYGGVGHITWRQIKRAVSDREKAASRRRKPRNAM